MAKKEDPELTARYADMLSAMGTEPRLRIVRLLLSAHPEGMVVGEVGEELGIPSSTLSHHLEKLKNEDLVHVRPTRKPSRSFSVFFMPNAVRGTRLCSRRKSFAANRRYTD